VRGRRSIISEARKGQQPVFAGVDVGAVSTKVALIRDGAILDWAITSTGADAAAAALKSFRTALRNASLARRSVRKVAATGYGRNAVHFADKVYTEIACHARGACSLFPGTDTVIDIGGQDCKIISVRDGAVLDFVMNDRCAAGTGRFLEIMSQALETPLEQMGREGLRAGRGARPKIKITRTCTVFAESEVVSLLAQGKPKGDIILALHEAVAERILGMAHSFPIGRIVTLSGGVAKNEGVVRSLCRALGRKLNIPEEPQIVGALGAAILASSL